MIEGKLVDGLRAVAAQMSMDELHENRSEFVQDGAQRRLQDLLKNGLELESVSLTALDQTPVSALDDNNAFNAVRHAPARRGDRGIQKRRAEIDAEARSRCAAPCSRRRSAKIELAREEEAARIAQIQEIETLRAAQELRSRGGAWRAQQSAEEARIVKEREVRAAEIAREQAVRAAEIAKERDVSVADQDRQIIIAQKSEEERPGARGWPTRRGRRPQRRPKRWRPRAKSRRRSGSSRSPSSRRRATPNARPTRLRLSAEAEKDAAADRAEARRAEAQGRGRRHLDPRRGGEKELLAKAEGQRAITEAENALSQAIVDMKVALARLEALPQIVSEMVKPAEKIGSIKIHQVTGLGAELGRRGRRRSREPRRARCSRRWTRSAAWRCSCPR